MKKKILWCSEACYLSTGYATYSREVLTRLFRTGNYEIGEIACYCPDGHSYVNECQWKVYPLVPHSGTQEKENYDRYPTAQFGELRFESILLDFKPDVVCGIKDIWMDMHVYNSPYRKCYNFVHMPTVDAAPQQNAWVELFSQADAILSYQDWSGKVLQRQGGSLLNYLGSAPPAASDFFHPKPSQERSKLKEKLLLGPDIKIVGTVMRNQRRKLYPNLFRAFRKFLDTTKRRDVILYCHLSYPDHGWDIPELIKEHGLSSKVYVTYICNLCGYIHPTVFQDAGCVCPQCHNFSCSISSPHRGVNLEQLNDIYNMFDLYVQYSNSEGFGVPLVESAATGTPVCGTNYSAMEDVIPKLGGRTITVRNLDKELETGCLRATPNNNDFVDYLTEFFSLPTSMRERKRQETRSNYEQNYSWDRTAQKWIEVINTLPQKSWNAPKNMRGCAPYSEHTHLSNLDYAKWLILEVLGEPERINTFFQTRIVRDLNYGMSKENLPGLYYNDMGHKFAKTINQPFTRKIAYDKMVEMVNKRNYWEHMR